MLRGASIAAGGILASFIGMGCTPPCVHAEGASSAPAASGSNSAVWQPLEHEVGYTHSTALPYPAPAGDTVGALKHVIVFARHGDRSIVRGKLGGWKLAQDDHAKSAWGRVIREVESRVPGQADLATLSPVSSAGLFPTVDAGRGDWPRGQLTPIGHLQLRRLGEWLRAAYVPQGFLPETLEDAATAASTVGARSTNYTRNFHSLQNLLMGLYPPSARAPGVTTPIVVRGNSDETLFPNAGGKCPPLTSASSVALHAIAVMQDAAAHPWDVAAREAALALAQRHLGEDAAGAAALLDDWAACTCAEAPVGDLFGFPADSPLRHSWSRLVRREGGTGPATDPTAPAAEAGQDSLDPVGAPDVQHVFNSHLQGGEVGVTGPAKPDLPRPPLFPWYATRDLLTCGYSHGVFHDLPGGAPHVDLWRTMERCGTRQFQAFYTPRPAMRLGMGRIFADVLSLLHRAAGQAPPPAAAQARPFALQGTGAGGGDRHSPPSIALFQVHDSTLMPFLTALRCFDGQEWMPYGSAIVIELYDAPAGGTQPQVRVLFNGKPLPLGPVASREAAAAPWRARAPASPPASFAEAVVGSDVPLTQPRAGWTGGAPVRDAEALVPLSALTSLLEPLTIGEDAYWDRCSSSTR